MRKILMMVVLCGAVIIAGCSNNKPEEQLSQVLTDMYDAEQDYRDNQEKLNKLEQDEQKLFNDTMELTDEDEKALEKNIKDLKDMVAERQEKLKSEAKSMKDAKDYVSKFDQIESEVEEEEKEKVTNLKTTAEDRYKKHEAVVKEYNSLTKLQDALYTMLDKDDVDLLKVEEQVTEVNTQNEKVIAAVDEFNQSTVELNKLKEQTFKVFEKNKE